jgi:hypothetical protein
MTTTTILLIAILAFMPSPKVSDRELEAFEKFIRWVWRAVVITAKLIAITVALVVAGYAYGADSVILALGYALLGIIGLRIFLWATEFIIPDNSHRFLSEKSDPDYLLKVVF